MAIMKTANTGDLGSQILVGAGGVAMGVGAVDPLEASTAADSVRARKRAGATLPAVSPGPGSTGKSPGTDRADGGEIARQRP